MSLKPLRAAQLCKTLPIYSARVLTDPENKPAIVVCKHIDE